MKGCAYCIKSQKKGFEQDKQMICVWLAVWVVAETVHISFR